MSYIATWVDPFLKDLFQRGRTEGSSEGRSYLPPADILDTSEAWEIVLDMPGVNQKGVSLELSEGVLSVTGTSDPVAQAGTTPVRTERVTGTFRRRFGLDGARVDAAGVKASIKDGVLRIRVPKAGPSKTHRIDVREEQ